MTTTGRGWQLTVYSLQLVLNRRHESKQGTVPYFVFILPSMKQDSEMSLEYDFPAYLKTFWDEPEGRKLPSRNIRIEHFNEHEYYFNLIQ
jgi:hypothetical protein